MERAPAGSMNRSPCSSLRLKILALESVLPLRQKQYREVTGATRRHGVGYGSGFSFTPISRPHSACAIKRKAPTGQTVLQKFSSRASSTSCQPVTLLNPPKTVVAPTTPPACRSPHLAHNLVKTTVRKIHQPQSKTVSKFESLTKQKHASSLTHLDIDRHLCEECVAEEQLGG
jgi:hypothetical protein